MLEEFSVMSMTRLTHQSVCLAITAVTITLITAKVVSAQPAATYDIVSSFDLNFGVGRAPSSLRQNSDGTFYGTTLFGGMLDKGTLFRLDAAGVFTPIHSFAGAADGA